MNLPDEIYIVVTEHDGNQEYFNLKKIPLALETYLNEECSKSEAIQKARRLDNRFGEVKIGRLVFDLDEPLDLSDAMTPEEKAEQHGPNHHQVLKEVFKKLFPTSTPTRRRSHPRLINTNSTRKEFAYEADHN